jgi:hypothetical protein
MPIRTASLTNQIHKNGARLHLAMLARVHSHGEGQAASEQEQALTDERRALKEAKAQRLAQPRAPRPQPAWMLKAAAAPKAVKAPKAAKEAKEPKVAKAAAKGNKPTRAEKLTKKAENLDAAKKATKKSAKT